VASLFYVVLCSRYKSEVSRYKSEVSRTTIYSDFHYLDLIVSLSLNSLIDYTDAWTVPPYT